MYSRTSLSMIDSAFSSAVSGMSRTDLKPVLGLSRQIDVSLVPNERSGARSRCMSTSPVVAAERCRIPGGYGCAVPKPTPLLLLSFYPAQVRDYSAALHCAIAPKANGLKDSVLAARSIRPPNDGVASARSRHRLIRSPRRRGAGQRASEMFAFQRRADHAAPTVDVCK